jgi:hypothetical protein
MTGSRPSTYGAPHPDTKWDVTRHLVEFLQWRFSLAPQGLFRWMDDETDTEVSISGDYAIDPEKIGHRPAITVTKGPIGFAGLSLGDVAFVDLKTGAMAYMDVSSTTVMINILSRIDIEASGLAEVVGAEIRANRRVIAKVSRGKILNIGQRIMIGAPSPPGALLSGDSPDGYAFACTVSVPVFLQGVDSAFPLNQKLLRRVEAGATASASPPRAQAVVPLQGTAIMQPRITAAHQRAAVGGLELPQTGESEAPSTEPLTVTIKT